MRAWMWISSVLVLLSVAVVNAKPQSNLSHWYAQPAFLYNTGPLVLGWHFPHLYGPSHISHLNNENAL